MLQSKAPLDTGQHTGRASVSSRVSVRAQLTGIPLLGLDHDHFHECFPSIPDIFVPCLLCHAILDLCGCLCLSLAASAGGQERGERADECEQPGQRQEEQGHRQQKEGGGQENRQEEGTMP